MERAVEYGTAYLQRRIDTEFALARHIGIVVEAADDGGVILSAPLAPNANHAGTAFGGSLFSVAVLAGWAWVTCDLAVAQIAADAVIQESSMRYLVPVHGTMRARLMPPAAVHVEKFRKMLHRSGRGRIRLEVSIHQGGTLSSEFVGVYAAAVR